MEVQAPSLELCHMQGSLLCCRRIQKNRLRRIESVHLNLPIRHFLAVRLQQLFDAHSLVRSVLIDQEQRAVPIWSVDSTQQEFRIHLLEKDKVCQIFLTDLSEVFAVRWIV